MKNSYSAQLRIFAGDITGFQTCVDIGNISCIVSCVSSESLVLNYE